MVFCVDAETVFDDPGPNVKNLHPLYEIFHLTCLLKGRKSYLEISSEQVLSTDGQVENSI